MSLKSMFMWYSATSAVVLLVIVIIVNWTSYSQHYLERVDSYKRAELYLQQPVCRDDHIKAQLGDYNHCKRSEHILDQSIRWLAIRDTALDGAHWLGFAGDHLTDTQMFKLWVLGAFIIVLGLWLGIFRVGSHREITLSMSPLLPTTAGYGYPVKNKKKFA